MELKKIILNSSLKLFAKITNTPVCCYFRSGFYIRECTPSKWSGMFSWDQKWFAQNQEYHTRDEVLHWIKNAIHGMRNLLHWIKNAIHGIRNLLHWIKNSIHGMRTLLHWIKNAIHGMRKRLARDQECYTEDQEYHNGMRNLLYTRWGIFFTGFTQDEESFTLD